MGHEKFDQPRKVKIAPIGCLVDGKKFLGDDYWLFLGITLVGGILAGIIPIVLAGPAHCGIALCLLNRARGKAVVFEDLLKGFDYFIPSLIATLIYFAAFIVCLIPIGIVDIGAVFMLFSGEVTLVIVGVILLLLCCCLLIVFSVIAGMVFLFSIVLIVDRKMEGVPATKLAWQAVRKNFSTILVAEIVETVVFLFAMSLCYFPALFLWPIMIAGKFVIYQKVLGVSTDQDQPTVAPLATKPSVSS